MFDCTAPGAIAVISAATHDGFHQSASCSASHVFLCLKSTYLSFVYNQKSFDQADQPSILHIPGRNGIVLEQRKATLTFSISTSHFLTFRSLLLNLCLVKVFII